MTSLGIKTVASTLPDKTQSAKGTVQAAATGMPEDEPASATKSGVEPGEVYLVDIDEDDPPADSASEPPAPSVGSGASAPASTASTALCGNLFAFGVVSTAPAAPAATLPDAVAFGAAAAPPAVGSFSFGSGAGPPAASPFRDAQAAPAAAGSFSFGVPGPATAPAFGAAAPAAPAFGVAPPIGASTATTGLAATPLPARSPASGVGGLSAAPAAAFFGQAPVPAFGAAPAAPASIFCATPFGAAPAAHAPAFGAPAPAPAFGPARTTAPAFGAAPAPTLKLSGAPAALIGGGVSAPSPSAFGGVGGATTGGFGGFGAAAVPAVGGFGVSAGALATPACGAPASAGAVPTFSVGAPAASTAATAGGLGTSNPFGAVVAKTSAEFGGSTANATASLRSQQAETSIPASTPAATEVRVQGTLSLVEACGLCCLAWNAAAKEVPLSINLEGVQASPETLAVACWALCPSVTSLSFERTRLTADGANTVALERLCGLLRGGHAAALTSVKLRGNELGDEGWGAIFVAICGNKDSKITSMNVSSENIGPAGVKLIAEALRTSVTGGLTVANLLGNQLDAESAKMLAEVAKQKGVSLCGIQRDQTTADFFNKGLKLSDTILLASDLSQAVVTGSLTQVPHSAPENLPFLLL